MTDEIKSRIMLCLFIASLCLASFYGGWSAANAVMSAAPEPVLVNGQWICSPPNKWHAKWIQQKNGGGNAIVCVPNDKVRP